MKKFEFYLATWFGSGLMKPAPGTWGSAAGLLTFYALVALNDAYPIFNFSWLMLVFTVLLFFIGISVSESYEKKTKTKDNSTIVIDEVVGVFLVLLWAYQTPGHFWTHGIIAFVLFRLFDIWKPYPIKTLEKRFNGGVGVMIDDVVAALYAILAYSIIGKITAEIFFR